MNCPRCQTKLVLNRINDINSSIEVDECPDCHGIWFDKDELSQIETIIEPTLIEIRKIPSKKDQYEKMNCPSCNNSPRLEKTVHPRDKKVIIDYCPYCKGIWLDKGELGAIQKENWILTIAKLVKRLA
jgi:Zn-finger nucleic acid-binding protein